MSIVIEKTEQVFVSIDSIFKPIANHLHEFEKQFKETLHSEVPLAEQVVRYIATLKGKRLRPGLVFLSAQLHGQSSINTMRSAIVVELLHTATLVHDDVVDDSDLRRGSPTIKKLWDNRISVLIGDLLFSRTLTAMVNLQDMNALTVLSKAANRITEGELLQIERDRDFEIDESIYFDLVGKKTAALFSASCELGALSVHGNNGQYAAYMRDFGENLGVAFQIKDDLLDYVGDESRLGKPIGNDIRENKVTLPLIYVLSQADGKACKEILNILNQAEISDDEIDKIIDYVREKGGLDYAINVANSFAGKAKEILAQYPTSVVKQSLENLVEFAINREN